MACLSFDITACIRCVYEETKFIPCAYWNKKKLEKEMGRLEGMRRDVTTIINNQKQMQPGTQCKVVVSSWLDKVNEKETEVNGLLESIQRRSGCTCCFASCNGRKLLELIDDVKALEEERKTFDDKELVEPIPVDPTDNIKDKLRKKMEELKKIQKDVKEIIGRQERENHGTECTVVVRRWLDDVNAILHSDAESSNCAENIANLLDTIQSFVEQGRKYLDGDMLLVCPIPFDPMDNVPDLRTPMVGRDSKLSEIDGYIKDSQVQIVGILGAGGIGKTTLLKSIKAELRSTNRDLFFYIIWIELSSHNNILDIQKQIAECIPLSFRSEDESERAGTLRKTLRHKKTLVLIDNVWNELDFERIGVPFSVENDHLKIVLTTRLERVCTDMRIQKIVKLDYLDKEESLQLFQKAISSDHVDHNLIVRQRVDKILKKCGGLPLAILTVARTVANYTRVEEWDDAVECLQNSPEDIKGMDDVMRCLKFSYDKLESNEIRSCLLYFSIIPDGQNWPSDDIVRYWIGEGFLDDISNKNSFKKSYDRGIVFLNKLKSLFLVESSRFSEKFDVKVHDVIRDMLCWISKNERKEVFLVYDKDQDAISNNNDWHLTKGMFVNERQLHCTLPEEGLPPNLTSLIFQYNYSHRIVKLPTVDFFRFTPSLRVLDLSYIGLVELPKSIGELGELRHLNLSRTPIKMLPVELGNLKKLECLDLGNTLYLESIPDVSISQLSMLQSLNLHNSKYRWDSEIINATEHRSLTLEDLLELKNLEELGVDVLSNSHLNTILASQILLKSITRIKFSDMEFTAEDLGQPIKLISERFPLLKRLIVEQCALPDNILEIKDVRQLVVDQLCLWYLEISSVLIVKDYTFHSLEVLYIFHCGCLKEVSWTAHIPFLKWLTVENCNGVEELVETREEEIEEEEHKCHFPKLTGLHIKDMENLHSIYGRRNRPLLFPALKHLDIQNCPKLKQLPLGHDSAKEILYIICEQHQWDSLEWEDDQVRARFLPYFRVG